MKLYVTRKHKQSKTTEKRLLLIHKYFQEHPNCTINDAVTFMPENDSMVQTYSKIRKKYENV